MKRRAVGPDRFLSLRLTMGMATIFSFWEAESVGKLSGEIMTRLANNGEKKVRMNMNKTWRFTVLRCFPVNGNSSYDGVQTYQRVWPELL